MFTLGSCLNAPCPFQELEYVVSNQKNNVELAKLTAKACTSFSGSVSINDDFMGRIYFNDVANSEGVETYHAFEMGQQKIFPVEIITQSEKHIFEIINKKDFSNNLNDPYPIELSDFELTGDENSELKKGSADIELNGHPLQLILALQDINDEGGAKTWKFFSAKDSSNTTDLDLKDDKWACFFDNEYTFMKGKRFKYNPKSTLCNGEKDYFPNKMPVNIFGLYTLNTNGENPIVELEVIENANTTRQENIEILEWSTDDWSQLTVKAKTPDGITAIAIMKVSETVEWSEF
ncbi:MAG: hypothetical protein ACPGLV_16385 [Bacteroidia bacterium]